MPAGCWCSILIGLEDTVSVVSEISGQSCQPGRADNSRSQSVSLECEAPVRQSESQ